MGADGCVERSEKRREWLHEAIDFIRVFANLGVCQVTPKKAKIRATLIVMFTRFLLLKKSAKLKVGISSIGTRLRGGLYWKGY